MRRILPVLLLLALLCGCSSMLERTYLVVTPHPEHPAIADDSDVLQVSTYQDLVNGVLYFVNQGAESGVIRLVDYTRDVESDLNSACLEVARDAPIGAYAVDFIKYDYTRVVKYYEASITISYRRTLEQIQSIQNVTGSTAIRAELREALLDFAPESVLHIAYFNEDETYIEALIRQAYYDAPAAAFGMPEYTVSLYPKTGSERIVEILLTYPEDPEVLQRRSAQLQQQAAQLTESFQALSSRRAAQSLFELLRDRVEAAEPASDGSRSTAYAALMENRADSQGVALAFQLLCQTLGLESTVVEGTLEGQSHFWNIFALEDGSYRHVDASRAGGLLLTDEELSALDYQWDREAVPACGSIQAAPSPSLPLPPVPTA